MFRRERISRLRSARNDGVPLFLLFLREVLHKRISRLRSAALEMTGQLQTANFKLQTPLLTLLSLKSSVSRTGSQHYQYAAAEWRFSLSAERLVSEIPFAFAHVTETLIGEASVACGTEALVRETPATAGRTEALVNETSARRPETLVLEAVLCAHCPWQQ